MSRYDELRAAYSEYSNAERQYIQENENLALLIVNGLREYLGMPNSFQRVEGTITHHESYTPFYRINEDGDFTKENFLMEALSHFTDGSFTFAFGVILEPTEGSRRKHSLILKAKCERKGSRVSIDVSDKKLNVTFDGQNCPEIAQVHELIFDLVKEWLKHRPGDGTGFSKFGFAMH